MKIIVGLGNPGKKYERTRHNAGFLVADEIARNLQIEISQEKYNAFIGKGRIGAEETILAKPQTFMNDSGRAVGALLRATYSTASELIVIHDELDIPFGTVRIKIGGGHGGHNGLRSIIEVVGSSDFVRVRVGIGRPLPGMDAAAYVLAPFSAEERALLPDVLGRAAEAASAIVQDGPTGAMNLFNQK
jgi:PTH1 family peptidyl-tRNA hydrolase